MTQRKSYENLGRTLKQCNSCYDSFEENTFPPGRARCKKCHSKKQKVSQWKSTLKHKYRISLDIYQAMHEDQGGRCYFCDDDGPVSGKGRLAVDHDKVTEFVRGLLCRPCNANWVDEYKKLPEEWRDSPRTNKYVRRGENGDYVESIRRHLANG